MANPSSPRFLRDFAGRRVTASAIIVAAFGSASLNVWGATQVFPVWQTAMIFAIVIAAGEVIAALALRHIVADWENRRHAKATLSGVIMALAVTGCVISGHRAFETLFLEAEAKHDALVIRAEAAQTEADAMHLKLLAADDGETKLRARSRWEYRQEQADEAKLAMLKAEPPSALLIYIFLALFETVKIGGLFSLATPTTQGLTLAQRRAKRRAAKLKEIESQRVFEAKLKAAEDPDGENVFPLRVNA